MKKIYSQRINKLLVINSLFILFGTVGYGQFSESFEGAGTPAGWSVINQGDANTWYFTTPGTGTANTGTHVARIDYDSSTAHDDYLVTPQFTVTAGVSDQLRFYAENRSSSFIEEFNVLISTAGNTSADFTTTLAGPIGPPTTWTEYIYDLSAFVGQPIYVAFQATSLNQWELYIDDVNVEAAPSCLPTANLYINNLTTTSADLSWDAVTGAVDYNVEWGFPGFTPGTGSEQGAATGVAGLSTTAGSLTPDTDYEFYVQTNCGGSTSTWVGPMSFYTGYCAFTGTGGSYYIDNFATTGGIPNNVTNLSSGFATNGYQDATTMVVSTWAGQTVNFTSDFVGGTFGFNIWVDWNNNMVFDASEKAAPIPINF